MIPRGPRLNYAELQGLRYGNISDALVDDTVTANRYRDFLGVAERGVCGSETMSTALIFIALRERIKERVREHSPAYQSAVTFLAAEAADEFEPKQQPPGLWGRIIDRALGTNRN